MPSLRPKWPNWILYFWPKCLKKNIPSQAGHTYTHIRENPSLVGQSHRKVSHINTFRSAVIYGKLELIYSSSFSTIVSLLYPASMKHPKLRQLSESQGSALAQIPLTPGLLMHKISKHEPLWDWISRRKRNTISFWEIASCCLFN